RMIATTISNSIREKPFCRFCFFIGSLDSLALEKLSRLQRKTPNRRRFRRTQSTPIALKECSNLRLSTAHLQFCV
ncbi:MAG: hypothetical protein WAK62_02770, partial [Terriglobales bacterium]